MTIHGQGIFGQSIGDPVSSEVERLYKKGLIYLQKSQGPDGSWSGTGGHYGSDPGVVGLCTLAILAHGEDPNYGPYSKTVNKALNFIIKTQQSSTGMIGSSMYSHSFATLCLAEAYGAVNDKRVGPALEKAVKLILSSQESNPTGAWRYSPSGKDADTTAAGACMVALFAARNAGLNLPKKSIDRCLAYYKRCQSADGGFGYTSPGSSDAPRSAIGALVFALAHKKKSSTFKRALNYIKNRGHQTDGYQFYTLYYMPQALFQSDIAYWKSWNDINIKFLKARQTKSGSWNGNNGVAFSTSAALLSLALNYRFLPIYER
ncbi:MAG: terpene cyclase/mutase family protein [Lentisphaeraceae bacterium]|nr:terpene cyclase/mutase family protein [Lentisphaeraceae bacterium]